MITAAQRIKKFRATGGCNDRINRKVREAPKPSDKAIMTPGVD
jgi:hypothetical protein